MLFVYWHQTLIFKLFASKRGLVSSLTHLPYTKRGHAFCSGDTPALESSKSDEGANPFSNQSSVLLMPYGRWSFISQVTNRFIPVHRMFFKQTEFETSPTAVPWNVRFSLTVETNRGAIRIKLDVERVSKADRSIRENTFHTNLAWHAYLRQRANVSMLDIGLANIRYAPFCTCSRSSSVSTLILTHRAWLSLVYYSIIESSHFSDPYYFIPFQRAAQKSR